MTAAAPAALLEVDPWGPSPESQMALARIHGAVRRLGITVRYDRATDTYGVLVDGTSPVDGLTHANALAALEVARG